MSYKITIEKTERVKKIQNPQWKVVDSFQGKDVYGHTPEIETWQDVTTEIYTQVVDDLNLIAVIDAVNKS